VAHTTVPVADALNPSQNRSNYLKQAAIAFVVGFILLSAVYFRAAYDTGMITGDDLIFGLPRIAAISLLPALLAYWKKVPLFLLVPGSALLALGVAIGYINLVT